MEAEASNSKGEADMSDLKVDLGSPDAKAEAEGLEPSKYLKSALMVG